MQTPRTHAGIRRCLEIAALLSCALGVEACAAQQDTAAVSLRGGERATLALASAPRGKGVLTVSVIAFTPSAAGGSEVVVRAAPGGAEIGRFGIFPNDAFRAASPNQAMHFDLPLTGRPLQSDGSSVQVELVAPPDARISFGAPRLR
ncbi:hypothetical protein [Variovorax guangxiensis]|uniref:hypothetical protein n=1 Tax=Variovorax guangxiensis TaxID=1775474 RepID=UPI00285F68EC|nr:hypothetical protein [Variovorax guangxiensis]MDR6860189.1 hypothetical protein [Variovorax guangxiensis]